MQRGLACQRTCNHRLREPRRAPAARTAPPAGSERDYVWPASGQRPIVAVTQADIPKLLDGLAPQDRHGPRAGGMESDLALDELHGRDVADTGLANGRESAGCHATMTVGSANSSVCCRSASSPLEPERRRLRQSGAVRDCRGPVLRLAAARRACFAARSTPATKSVLVARLDDEITGARALRRDRAGHAAIDGADDRHP